MVTSTWAWRIVKGLDDDAARVGGSRVGPGARHCRAGRQRCRRPVGAVPERGRLALAARPGRRSRGRPGRWSGAAEPGSAERAHHRRRPFHRQPERGHHLPCVCHAVRAQHFGQRRSGVARQVRQVRSPGACGPVVSGRLSAWSRLSGGSPAGQRPAGDHPRERRRSLEHRRQLLGSRWRTSPAAALY